MGCQRVVGVLKFKGRSCASMECVMRENGGGIGELTDCGSDIERGTPISRVENMMERCFYSPSC